VAVGSTARYLCGDEERRGAIRRAIGNGVAVNGIDSLEVLDQELAGLATETSRQRILLVQFFDDGIAALGPDKLLIEGGVRVTPVVVRWARVLSGITAAAPAEILATERQFLAGYRVGEVDRDRILAVGTAERGDYSTYRLSIVDPGESTPLAGFDPRLSEVDFSFKVECPSDFDCKDELDCEPAELPEPEIDYLAKDYASFRRLMLDRMSAIIPDWQERSPADLGVALVELLAYVGDQLSYYQDAVATEAYLGTAKQRISLRRHARLVDYLLGEGANARAWVVMEVAPASNADGATLAARQTRLLTRFPGRGPRVGASELAEAMRYGSQVFETLTAVTLRSSLNRLELYTWSNRACCLPIGATTATLAGEQADLEPGMFLMLEEVLGARTGDSADADPTHVWVVRLTRVETGVDPVELAPVTEVEWSEADALPFPLCVSAETDEEHGSLFHPAVGVARGNVVAADHGFSVAEDLADVPAGDAIFRPRLSLGVLVHAPPSPPGRFPATALAPASATVTQPAVSLELPTGEVWGPQFDLLASDAFAQEFVAEIENDGRARLRFGDGVNGLRPMAGSQFRADYRVGAPQAGNVGTDAIAHVIDGPAGLTRVRNPRPAFGSRAPESAEEVRRYAPEAFRTQQRAVTADDYARAAERHPEVQRAYARFRWTGSWYTVFVSVDRVGGKGVDRTFAEELRRHLNQFRMAGVDLEIRPPIFVGLRVAMTVCVADGYERAAVKKALVKVFANRGSGFFHPDRWTFGQAVYLSHLYERAVSVAGVDSVAVTALERFGQPPRGELAEGVLRAGEQEILRLDNDPSLRENGLLEIVLEGGV